MARFSSLRRRALRRAAVAAGPAHQGRSFRSRLVRVSAPLALTLVTVALVFRVGRSLLSLQVPSPFGTTTSTSTSNSANSLSDIAKDYYSAYQGTPQPPAKNGHLNPARFGNFAPRAVGAPKTELVTVAPLADAAGFGGVGMGSLRNLPAGSATELASPLVSGRGPIRGNLTGETLSLSGLPVRQITAQGEIAARERAKVRQSALLNRFLQTAQAREGAALQSDVNEARRSLADAVRAAGQLDLGPLPVELPDAEIQLEMTNLRLKLTPGLKLAPGEREGAEVRLKQLEAEWNARLARERAARGEEIERLRTERPREVGETGERQLDEQTRTALARNAQERELIAAQLQASLSKDATQQPLSVTLPSVKGATGKAARPAPSSRVTPSVPR